MSRPETSFDLGAIDQHQAMESALLIQLALDLRRLGTDEDVSWAQELTKQMPERGDAGGAWWAERVRGRLDEIAGRR